MARPAEGPDTSKLEAMATLAGGIAHDFNNVLGAILGYAELAHAQAVPGSSQQHQLEGVINAGLRAKSLVRNILAFSHSGLAVKVPMHVQAVAQQALDLLQTALPAGITLERELRAGAALLLGDPALVHQVVMNLVTNAVQASSAPGIVRVHLGVRHLCVASRFTVGELLPGAYVELEVRDEGVGMTPDQVERAFDPFFTTRHVGVGTGLGLSLVHGIVTDLGGAVDVSSAPAAGSRFTVLLPCEGEIAAIAGATTDEDSIPRGRGERILVVDDEAPLVALAEETLAILGYEPVGYTSSAEALQALRNAPLQFDALLTDEAMPQVTGSELADAAQAACVREVLAKPLVARDIAGALARALRPAAGAKPPGS